MLSFNNYRPTFPSLMTPNMNREVNYNAVSQQSSSGSAVDSEDSSLSTSSSTNSSLTGTINQNDEQVPKPPSMNDMLDWVMKFVTKNWIFVLVIVIGLLVTAICVIIYLKRNRKTLRGALEDNGLGWVGDKILDSPRTIRSRKRMFRKKVSKDDSDSDSDSDFDSSDESDSDSDDDE